MFVCVCFFQTELIKVSTILEPSFQLLQKLLITMRRSHTCLRGKEAFAYFQKISKSSDKASKTTNEEKSLLKETSSSETTRFWHCKISKIKPKNNIFKISLTSQANPKLWHLYKLCFVESYPCPVMLRCMTFSEILKAA